MPTAHKIPGFIFANPLTKQQPNLVLSLNTALPNGGQHPSSGAARHCPNSLSALAASTKSLSVRPLTLCVQTVSFTLPQVR